MEYKIKKPILKNAINLLSVMKMNYERELINKTTPVDKEFTKNRIKFVDHTLEEIKKIMIPSHHDISL